MKDIVTKPELTQDKFDLIADMIRSRGEIRGAAQRVLVNGMPNRDVLKIATVSGASLSNALSRFRKYHRRISEVYSPESDSEE